MKNNNNSNDDDMIELWGQDFRKSKDGLDQKQIVAYVDELINERDTLLKRQEHLTSLSMLAERTIAEADNVAQQIKDEATEKAETEAKEIVARAEEQAQQIIEEKKAEAIAHASEEAEAIKADAQQEAELLKKEELEKAQSEAKNMVKGVYQGLLAQLESLKQQVTALETDYEQTVTQPPQVNQITADEEEYITPSNIVEVSYEATDSIAAEAPEEIQTVEQPDESLVDEGAQLSPTNNETANYEGEVELEVLPPIEMRKIMGIISYLDNLAEVRATELIPLADRPLVKVSLREPIQLIQMLRALTEVGQATEVIEDEQRKIQITLAEPSILDEGKQKLNDEVYQILSQ